jgi:1-deoxy-D-xylulose-5-phosphate synthase
VNRLATGHDAIVTVEENAVAGGAGGAVAECLATLGIERPIQHVGLPDAFIEHGSRGDCLATAGLDAAGIEQSILRFWHGQKPTLALASAR